MSYDIRSGYIRITGSRHPLARNARGRVDLHRVLCYEEIGPGLHPCTHCGWEIDWAATKGDTKLVVDHLDARKLNLEPDNLAPSCWWCNRCRHLAAARAAGDLHQYGAIAPSSRPRIWQAGVTTHHAQPAAQAERPEPAAAGALTTQLAQLLQ